MRVLIVSKILGVAAYRRKLDEIAAEDGLELVAVAPPEWQEPGGRRLTFEPSKAPEGYTLRIEPIWLNGSYHLFVWPTLGRILREVRPDVVHVDEEPYNLATAHATWLARRLRARPVFFTWQNLLRRYPPPFSLFERSVFKHSAFGIAGSRDALEVVRAKGYCGPGAVIPQFGVDPELFAPGRTQSGGMPIIGFIGRLVEEKGLLVLLEALAGITSALHHRGSSGALESRKPGSATTGRGFNPRCWPAPL